MSLNVRLEVFEGPLALLMHLIEKNQIDIYDIPIADVTEQYLAYISSWNEFNMEVASEFLLMAATLLQIKSRMLLPKPPVIEEDEAEEEDPRQELVNRLIEYRRFKQLAAILSDMGQKRELFHTRSPVEITVHYPLLAGLDADQLVQAFLAVWESKVPEFRVVAREEVSVQDKMVDIVYLLTHHAGKIKFTDTFIRSGSRQEIVASFLAILELLRLKRLVIEQQEAFGPIYLMMKE